MSNYIIDISNVKIGEKNAVKINGFTLVKFLNVKLKFLDENIDIKVFNKNKERVGFTRIYKKLDFSGRGRDLYVVHKLQNHEIFNQIKF